MHKSTTSWPLLLNLPRYTRANIVYKGWLGIYSELMMPLQLQLSLLYPSLFLFIGEHLLVVYNERNGL